MNKLRYLFIAIAALSLEQAYAAAINARVETETTIISGKLTSKDNIISVQKNDGETIKIASNQIKTIKLQSKIGIRSLWINAMFSVILPNCTPSLKIV